MAEAAPAAMTPLYEKPVLVVDPGMHTAAIMCCGGCSWALRGDRFG